MRKLLYLLFISILFISCENDLPFNINDNPPKLVVNALFDSECETNVVFLALTGRDKATFVSDGIVDIFVNGELRQHVTEATKINQSAYYNTTNSAYEIKVKLAPNDIIRLEAKTKDGKYQAWSELKVPEPIPIDRVDTTIVIKKGSYGYGNEYLKIKTTFTDKGDGTNYYRILAERNLTIEGKSPYTGNDTIIKYVEPVSLIIQEDIVLTDGRLSTGDHDDDIITPVQNVYGVFDNSRINGVYTMITSIPYSYYYDDYGYGSVDNLKSISIDVKIRLQRISKMQYMYLKALNIYDSVDYDDVFNLPIKFPSNIEGGTGIFGVSAEKSYLINIHEEKPFLWQ